MIASSHASVQDPAWAVGDLVPSQARSEDPGTPRISPSLGPDRLGRIATKLRVQITDACNLRCLYCMGEDAVFRPVSDHLSPREFGEICSMLRGLGMREVRVTGGEPSVRPDFLECVERIAEAGWDRVGITTNGLRLESHAGDLVAAGVHGVNVSLDSLDPDNFRRISRRPGLDRVLRGVAAARGKGLAVKINCVVMAGVNEHEVPDFAEFSAREGIEVRFLEAMKVGPLAGTSPLVPSSRLRERLTRELGEPSPTASAPDATARTWVWPGGARLGFVSSETEPFCGGCSRLRLTSTGLLRPCLFREEGPSVKGLSGEALERVVSRVLEGKPLSRLPSTTAGMNAIGG